MIGYCRLEICSWLFIGSVLYMGKFEVKNEKNYGS